jgi:hypothetical protein
MVDWGMPNSMNEPIDGWNIPNLEPASEYLVLNTYKIEETRKIKLIKELVPDLNVYLIANNKTF